MHSFFNNDIKRHVKNQNYLYFQTRWPEVCEMFLNIDQIRSKQGFLANFLDKKNNSSSYR